MNWRNLYKIKTRRLLAIALSIPLVIYVLVWFLDFDEYTSDPDALGKRIIFSTLILFAVYGFIIFRTGFNLIRIGLNLKNVFYGILYGASYILSFI